MSTHRAPGDRRAILRILGAVLGASLGAGLAVGWGACSMLGARGCDGGGCVAMLVLGLLASPVTAVVGGLLGFVVGRAIADSG